MKAEFGIDDEGRAYVCLDGMTMTEWNMLKRIKAFLPLTVSDYDGNARITGDRLPGMGNLTAQDATAPTVSTEESIARKREAQNVTCAYPNAVELPGVSRSYSPGEIESLVWLSHHSTSLQGSTAARIVLDRVIADLEAMRGDK